MGLKTLYSIAVGLLLFSMVASAAFAATESEPETIVIVNSYDWHDLFLGAMYAQQYGEDNLYYFQTLADAQVKTKSIEPSSNIILFESTEQPVVRDYNKFLTVNGFRGFETIKYEDYIELQDILFLSENPDKLIILDAEFGVEAISISPLIVKRGYAPIFLSAESRTQVEKAAKSADTVILAGYFPVRLIEKIDATESFVEIPESNTLNISRRVTNDLNEQWGVLTRIENVDFISLIRGIPVFVYMGSVDETSEVIEESKITNFEVVSAELADVATAIESDIGRDLRFLVKYARTVTGINGLRGQILELDTVYVNYPQLQVAIEGVTYYPDINKLLVTYRNKGNIATKIFSNVEFSRNALTDDQPMVIPAGKSIDIPYTLNNLGPDTTETIINTQYGLGESLTKNVLASDGLPLLRFDASQGGRSPNVTMSVEEASIDTEKGIVYVNVKNEDSQSMQITALMLVNESGKDPYAIASQQVELKPQESIGIPIRVPYVRNEVIANKVMSFTIHYGSEQTTHTLKTRLMVEPRSKLPEHIFIIAIVIVVVIVLLIGLISVIVLASQKEEKSKTFKKKSKHK